VKLLRYPDPFHIADGRSLADCQARRTQAREWDAEARQRYRGLLDIEKRIRAASARRDWEKITSWMEGRGLDRFFLDDYDAWVTSPRSVSRLWNCLAHWLGLR
jgi:hypothetical protein